MIYQEIKYDLFQYPADYYVQCISSDFALGAGIAVQFNKKFNTKTELFNLYKNKRQYYWNTLTKMNRGYMLPTTNVLNLVTKERYWNKPTYTTLTNALCDMKMYCILQNIKNIAMPTIGCGLDKLNWEKVRQIIQDIFQDTNINITVCIQ